MVLDSPYLCTVQSKSSFASCSNLAFTAPVHATSIPCARLFHTLHSLVLGVTTFSTFLGWTLWCSIHSVTSRLSDGSATCSCRNLLRLNHLFILRFSSTFLGWTLWCSIHSVSSRLSDGSATCSCCNLLRLSHLFILRFFWFVYLESLPVPPTMSKPWGRWR